MYIWVDKIFCNCQPIPLHAFYGNIPIDMLAKEIAMPWQEKQKEKENKFQILIFRV